MLCLRLPAMRIRTAISSRLIVVCGLAVTAGSNPCLASLYDGQLRRGLEECERIERSAHESGMWLNPEGYGSYYLRSACFQRLAVRMRALDLCKQVRRRWSLLSSSWGYSEGNCIELVKQGIGQDQEALAQLRREYHSGPVKLTGFRVERNGNGRDYDIVPSFAPGYASGYHLAFWIIADGKRYLLCESGFHLTGDDNIRMFEYRKDIVHRFSAFRPGNRYTVQAELALSISTGSQAGWWSPEFIEAEFPAAERTQLLSLEVLF